MESNRLRYIKMRHLSAFVETVRLGSLKSASEHLGLSQPTISKTLRDLEDILGAPVLIRDRGGIELTREGAILRQFAQQSLAALGHGLASLDALASGASAPLRIGALPSVAADLLPETLTLFDELSPGTPLTIEDGPITALVENLRAGALDLVIGRGGRPETMTGLSFTQLYSEQVVFAAGPDHPQKLCDTPNALETERVLYPPRGAAIRPLVDRFMLAWGVREYSNRIETVSSSFGRAMTLGPARTIWIISQGVVAQDLAAGRMVTLPIDTQMMAGPVGILARSEDDPTPPMRLFRQALNETCNSRLAAQTTDLA